MLVSWMIIVSPPSVDWLSTLDKTSATLHIYRKKNSAYSRTSNPQSGDLEEIRKIVMSYREIAARQRGFLLRSQLTEEEIKEARDTGFIIEEDLEATSLHPEHIFRTQLSEYSYNDGDYWLWLLAFPTVPPERRNPMPYYAGARALQIRGIGRIGSGDPTRISTPPELIPYINTKDFAVEKFVVDDNIQPTDWSLVDDIPVENILPALRKYLMTNDDFEDSADATLDAHDEGCSWDELAEVL